MHWEWMITVRRSWSAVTPAARAPSIIMSMAASPLRWLKTWIPFVSTLTQEDEVFRVCRAFLAGGHADAGVKLLRLLKGVEQLSFARLRHAAEDG